LTVLITGASGATGRAVMAALLARGARVRTMSSNAESAAKLTAAGAHETAVARFDDSEALRRAMTRATRA
jgi:uncharacterized protein YbjT (DUF2867 family)